MNQFIRFVLHPAVLIAFMVALPLLGVAADGQPVSSYLHLPPQPRAIEQPGFSWWLAGPLIVGSTGLIALFVWRLATTPGSGGSLTHEQRRLPWWGWLGLGGTILAWAVAWTRFDLFEPIQGHTFTPLWFGYVVTVSGFTFRRSGRCLMTENPKLFVLLFPLSAAFWWLFEYFNRFVGNWVYADIGRPGGLEYFLLATLPFATVIPAVLATTELIATFPRLATALSSPLPVIDVRYRSWVGGSLLLAGGGGLLFIGIYPKYLFPLVWVAPLIFLLGGRLTSGGDLRAALLPEWHWPVLAPCFAALICGFFWEMWNSESLAHWEYSVPFVQRWLLFEMPVLGYTGYIPFGLECAAVAVLLSGWSRREQP